MDLDIIVGGGGKESAKLWLSLEFLQLENFQVFKSDGMNGKNGQQ